MLTDTYHIHKYLKSKCEKLYGYICSTLARHPDINRVEFGSTIWSDMVSPAITHGCSIWFNNTVTSRECVKSFQNKCARGVLKLRCKPASCALLSDLGWLPIDHLMDNMRFKYFKRLSNEIDKNWLLYKIWDKIKCTGSNYSDNIKTLLSERGSDFSYDQQGFSTKQNIRAFNAIGRNTYLNNYLHEICQKSTLQWYQNFKLDTKPANYLYTPCDFVSAQLKFKARSGCIKIGVTLRNWGMTDGMCTRCNNKELDDYEHFLFKCSCLAPFHDILYGAICNDLYTLNRDDIWTFFNSSIITKINFLLGDHGYFINSDIGKLFDRHIKSFLFNVKDYF